VDKNNNIPNSFDLPEGYFRNSKAGILNKIEWMQEHEAFPVLKSLSRESGFTIPENYFDLSASKLELVDAPVLNSYPKQNVFEVPQNYFEENKTRIVSLIEERDELSAYPTLSSIERTNPFVTGENYFETSKNKILGKKNEGGAKIISLFGKPLRYAAAAVLMISIGLWMYTSYFKTTEVLNECTTLACLEKREILKFKYENIDTDELIDAAVDLNKLEKNLNKTEKNDTTKAADSTDEALLDLIDQ
jgi:hypothetical protein